MTTAAPWMPPGAPAAAREPTAAQRAQERSMLFVVVVDAFMVAAVVLGGVVGGSLTMLAEAMRGLLGYASECFTVVLLRRIHRGVLADMEFGAGKLEQVASIVIAASMLFAAAWIGLNVLKLWNGERPLGPPIGLAFAAIVGMANLYVNVLAWDSVRRSMSADASLILMAQLKLRRVKMISSTIVSIGLTVSALSTDDVVVAWADSLGSLFVAGYMIVHASGMLREAIPDLLDRSAGAGVRAAIAEALAAHAGEFEHVVRARSRRSGRSTFIEIQLACDPALHLTELQRRADALTSTIRKAVAHAEVCVLATAAARPGVDADA